VCRGTERWSTAAQSAASHLRQRVAVMHRCACAIFSPTTNTFCTWCFWEMRFIWRSVVTVIKETHLTGRQGCQKWLRIFSFRPWLAYISLRRGKQSGVQGLKGLLHERVLSFNLVLCSSGGRDISVGIATRYGLEGLEFESRSGRDFPQPSRPAWKPTQPGLSLG
jgi:hypothetical protein